MACGLCMMCIWYNPDRVCCMCPESELWYECPIAPGVELSDDENEPGQYAQTSRS